MNKFKEGSNWKCYAYASRFVFEEEGKMRSGIEFEVIHLEKISAFLKRDKELALNSQNESYISLLNHYLEYGMDNDEFYQKKLSYLGNSEDIYYLTIWFDVEAEAEEIVLTDWYYFEEKGYFEYFIIPFMEDEAVMSGSCSIYSIKEDEKDILNKLMETHSLEGKTIKAKKSLNEELIQQIDRNTNFYGARVYYVGAALCMGIYSAWYSSLGFWVPKQTEIYFDFGYRSGSSSRNIYVRGNSSKAIGNLSIILKDLIDVAEKVIILSHWHSDHICLIRQIINDSNYNPFWAKSTWYAPQTSSPISNIVAYNLNLYGGTLKIQNNVFPANNRVYKINNNANIIYGKIDAFDPITASGKHPHHHGLYAKVKFIDLLNRENQKMLLVGDCTYSGIADIHKKDCSYLQACHHGGNYSLSPCNQNIAVNILDIPRPKADNNYKYVIYSANGVSHGHPNTNIVSRHNTAGWIRAFRTDWAINGRLWVTYYNIRDI